MDITAQLRELSKNLWWTWQPDLIALFRDIDPDRWRDTNHNPVAFLSGIAPEKIAQAVKDQALEARVSQAFHRLEAYLKDPGTWGGIYAGPLHDRPIAYFSAAAKHMQTRTFSANVTPSRCTTRLNTK